MGSAPDRVEQLPRDALPTVRAHHPHVRDAAERRLRHAIVPQHPTIFDGSIRENLVGGNRESELGDDFLKGILKTCRLPQLAEKIQNMLLQCYVLKQLICLLLLSKY